MALKTYKHQTPQSEPLPGQVKNEAGGYSYAIDDWKRLERFLILGSDGGTYYTSEQKLTRENALCVERCLKADGKRTVDIIVDVSDRGRAPKNDPALFALAMCAKLGDEETQTYANRMLPKVARIGTHIEHYVQFVKIFGGISGGKKRGKYMSGTRGAVSKWFLGQTPDELALQAVKYPQRDGMSLTQILRMARPFASHMTSEQAKVIDYIVDGLDGNAPADYPRLICGTEMIKGVTDGNTAAELIREYRLPQEVVPTTLLNDVQVWDALLPNLGLAAIIRNLPKMTAVGLLEHRSDSTEFVIDRLTQRDQLRRARIHPMQILIALKTYASGASRNVQFRTVQKIVDALDAAFYMSFENVEPTGKNILIGLDVSGSMSSYAGGLPISCREAAGALCLITARVEKNYQIMGFAHEFRPIDIKPTWRLDDVVNRINMADFGGTDCSLPMIWADAHRPDTEAFAVYTDNQTWYGGIHPSEALKNFRKKHHREAKLIVNAMTSTSHSIADPNDGGMLDVIGMDTAAPSIMADFIRN